MLQKNISKRWKLKLLSPLVIAGTIAVADHFACAQVTSDQTLGTEQSIVNSNTSHGSFRQQIEGGAIRGSNLFHSFREFNIAEGQSVYFQNPIGIRNIISRVTGGNPSHIEGTLGVSGGTANLFLLNRNGILFGANARLDVRGAFVATTATAIQFGNQGFFSSSTPDSPALLTVNPSAFLFNQVAAAAIVNRSIAPLELGGQGLQVPDGQSLLLLGGNVNFAGGGVNAAGGRVELGAVAGAGTVELSLNHNDLHLRFPATLDRANISLTNGATVNTSGEGGGSIQIWGRRVFINSGSQVAASTQGAEPGGRLTVNASESLEVIGFVPLGSISTLSFGDGKAGDLTIETRNLRVRDGAQIFAGTLGNGSAGRLSVNASESIEVAGRDNNTDGSSSLASFTGSAGQAGNLTIHTNRLIVRDGGALSTQSLIVSENGQVLPVSGEGGNITINAADSVELSREGFIFTATGSAGNAGNIAINTGRLLVQDGSEIGAQSLGSGNAGNIAVQARSIALRNQSQIDAQTAASQGGDIRLQVPDLLLLRNGSSISTTAGTAQAGGDGGNISIDSPFIVTYPNENSDISANAFSGRGGNVEINAQSLFGIEARTQATPLSDITASSETGVAGVVSINTPDVDPNRGLVQLPVEVTDASRLIVQSCPAGNGRNRQQNEFIVTGRGGLPPTPDEAVNPDAIQVDLVTTEAETEPSVSQDQSEQPPPIRPTLSAGAPIVEAQGWQVGADGKVMLVAATPERAFNRTDLESTAPSPNALVHCR